MSPVERLAVATGVLAVLGLILVPVLIGIVQLFAEVQL